MKNTLTVEELITHLKKVNFNKPVFINCSYNHYEINQFIDQGDRLVITVGNVNNPDEYYDEPDRA